MFDTEYFRTTLDLDIDAVGAGATVELQLTTGRVLRLRSVLAIQPAWVTLEAFLPRADDSARAPRWKEEAGAGKPPLPTMRVAVSYENIVAVTVTPSQAVEGPKVGFVR